MNNLIDNKIRKYSQLFTSYGPVKFNDYISNKHDDIHKQLYTEALDEWLTSYITNYKEIESLEDDVETLKSTYYLTHKFIGHKTEEYNSPIKVSIISTEDPYIKTVIDLTPYWDKYIYNENNKDFSELNINDDIKSTYEVIYINYVLGTAKFRNKNTGKVITAPINFINANTKFNDDMTLKSTFTYKYNKGK